MREAIHLPRNEKRGRDLRGGGYGSGDPHLRTGAMAIVALILSVLAFAYLLYAMLRPERF